MSFDPANVNPEEIVEPIKELIERQEKIADIKEPEDGAVETGRRFEAELPELPQIDEPQIEAQDAPVVQAPPEPQAEEQEPAEIPEISQPEPPESEDPVQNAILEQVAAMLSPVVFEVNAALSAVKENAVRDRPPIGAGVTELVESLNDAFAQQQRQLVSMSTAIVEVASQARASMDAVQESLRTLAAATKEAVESEVGQATGSALGEYIRALQAVQVPIAPVGDGGLGGAFVNIEEELVRTRPLHVSGDFTDVYNDGQRIGLIRRHEGPYGSDEAQIVMPLTESFSIYAHYSGERTDAVTPHYGTVCELYIGKFCHIQIRVEARQCDGIGAANNHPGSNQVRWMQNADGGDTEILNSLSVWNGGRVYPGTGAAAEEWVPLAWTIIETDGTIDYSAGASHTLKEITVQASFDQAEGYLTVRIKNEREGAYSFVLVGTINVTYHTAVSDPHSPPDSVELGNCECHDMYPTDDWNEYPWGEVPADE